MTYYPVNTIVLNNDTIKSQYDYLLGNAAWLFDRASKQSVQAQGMIVAAPILLSVIGSTVVLTNPLTLPVNDLETTTWALGATVEGQTATAGGVARVTFIATQTGGTVVLPVPFAPVVDCYEIDRTKAAEPITKITVAAGATASYVVNGRLEAGSTRNYNVWRITMWAHRVG